MLGEFEISQMILDINEAEAGPRLETQTQLERIHELLAVQNALLLITDWTEKRQQRWYKFVGRE